MRNKPAQRRQSSYLTADEDNETLDHLLSLSCRAAKIGGNRSHRNAPHSSTKKWHQQKETGRLPRRNRPVGHDNQNVAQCGFIGFRFHTIEGERYSTDVCGNTTFTRDYLGRDCRLPALRPDDVLAILDVGAYGYAMSSHFLHRPRPAEVLVENGGYRLIRRREDYGVLSEHQC
jgi:hypothetical protein